MATVESLQAMLARGQDSALLRYSLGAEHLKLRQYQPAIEHLQRALVHDVNYSAAYKLLGEALAAAGRAGEAMQVYARGIDVANGKGDMQAAREMAVFLKRLQKTSAPEV